MKIFFVLYITVLLVFAAGFASADGTKPLDYKCQICRDFIKRFIFFKEPPHLACKSKDGDDFTLLDGCSFMLQENRLLSKLVEVRAQHERHAVSEEALRDMCHLYTAENICPLWEDSFGTTWRPLHADSAGFDIRVAPASSWMSSNSVRVTMIDPNSTIPHGQPFLQNFSYNAPFQYYATEKIVHTGVFYVPNTNHTSREYTLNIGGEVSLPVRLVAPGQGIRSIVLGDPCLSGEYVTCAFGAKWSVLTRVTQLLNTLAQSNDSLHLWQLLGDNFYDPVLNIAPMFFRQLNMQALGTPFLSTIGNHDQAQHGMCSDKHTGINTNGASYIQYYGQNTLATKNETSPFDWSGYSPTNFNHPNGLAPPSNHFQATLVGNTAFILYNGANTLEDTLPYFAEACQWVSETKPSWIFVVSHWSAENCGCSTNMAANEVRDRLATMSGCSDYANRLKWLEGHSHVNKVVRANVGFRFGGTGMGDSTNPSDPNFGIPFIDTYRNRLQIWYFPIAHVSSADNGDAAWAALMKCVTSQGGLHQCTHLAESFLDQPLL